MAEVGLTFSSLGSGSRIVPNSAYYIVQLTRIGLEKGFGLSSSFPVFLSCFSEIRVGIKMGSRPEFGTVRAVWEEGKREGNGDPLSCALHPHSPLPQVSSLPVLSLPVVVTFQSLGDFPR